MAASCLFNSTTGEVTNSKTFTATLTWQGTGTAPKRVKVKETAVVSWLATLTVPKPVGASQPPHAPNGMMTGSCSTGLTDVSTPNPNPQDSGHHGETKTGTREQTITIPDSGVYTFAPVTLTASAKADTGDETKGGASIDLTSYTVDVPGDGSATATATVTITPPAGWVASNVNYQETADGTYARDIDKPTITVFVGSGVSQEKTLYPIQKFTYSVAPGGNPPSLFTASAKTEVSGNISQAGSSFYASSDASIGGSATGTPSMASGSAPPGTQYSDEKSSAAYKPSPIVTYSPDWNSVVTINMTVRAKASTIGQ